MGYNSSENVPASRRVAWVACFRLRKIGAQVISTPTSDRAVTFTTQLPNLPPQLRRLRQSVFLPLQHIRDHVGQLHMARLVRRERPHVWTPWPKTSRLALNIRPESTASVWDDVSVVVPQVLQFPDIKDLFCDKPPRCGCKQRRLVVELTSHLHTQPMLIEDDCRYLSILKRVLHHTKQNIRTVLESMSVKFAIPPKAELHSPLGEHVLQFLVGRNANQARHIQFQGDMRLWSVGRS